MRTFTGIQALRGVAALSVVCGHAMTMRMDMGIPWQFALDSLGLLQSGVDVFFVISGFIIANTAARIGAVRGRSGAIGFMFNRAGRIYPTYWFILSLAILSSYWVDLFPGVPAAQVHVGIKNWLLLEKENWFVAQSWTLTYELIFYTAVACIIAVAPQRVVPVLIVAFCALAAIDLLTPWHLWVYTSPITLEFGFGVMIAHAVGRGFHPSHTLVTIVAATFFFGIGAHAATVGHFEGFDRVATFGIGSALLVYTVIAAELNGTTFPRWLQYAGAISYSLYISHHLLLTWLARFDPPWLPGPVQILIWIGCAFGLAAAIYRYFEKPTLKKLGIRMPPESALSHSARPDRPETAGGASGKIGLLHPIDDLGAVVGNGDPANR
jgi:exopolysaccharide production protein ExoZ